MKQLTLDTKIVDGFQIITGFQERVIDPVATQEKNKDKILDLPENQAIINKIQVQNRHRENARLAERKSIAALMRNNNKDGFGGQETDKIKIQENNAEIGRQDQIRRDLFGAMGVINEELKILNCACQEKSKQILRDNPVYNDEVVDPDGKPAGPKKNEVILPQSEIKTLKVKFLAKKKTEQIAIGDGERIFTGGEAIPDFRGRAHYFKDPSGKWIKGEIEELGMKPTFEIFIENLTADQSQEIQSQENTERIAAMEPDKKQIEFDLQDDSILSQAAVMKNKLEIKGDPEALIKSQEFYKSETDKLKLLYELA